MHPLRKKLARNLLRDWGQSLAVASVVACGIAAYVCVQSAYLNLALTRDTYYARQRMADFEFMLERAPETAARRVAAMPGVRRAEARVVADAIIDLPGVDEPRSGRLISLPVPRGNPINDIIVTRGRYFDGAARNQAILSERFAAENGLDVGDLVQLSVDGGKHTLRVVGLGLSPEYVYMIRNVQELIPAPERFGIVWVPGDFARGALGMQAACNNIVGLLDDPGAVDALFDRAERELKPHGLFAKVRREDQISNRFLTDEIKGLGVSATITPTIFLGIAAVILLVLLNRMVRIERPQIGLLKAFGYTDAAIAAHYLQYALALCLAGGAVGILAGQWLSGLLIQVYVHFYQFPVLVSRAYPGVAARALGLCVGFGLAGAASAAWAAARIHPAEAMRPAPPRAGRRVALERLPRAWRALTFTGKMVARNLARNRGRAAFTVFGVAVSTALMLFGAFSSDAMRHMLHFQFERVQREDARVALHREHGAAALRDIAALPQVRRAEGLLEYPFRLRNGHRQKEVVITGLDQDGEMRALVDEDGATVVPGERGVVLSDRLARELAVRPGDTVFASDLTGRVPGERAVVVTRVTRQYLGMGAYMRRAAMSRLLGEEPILNAALIRVADGEEDALKRALKDIAAVSAVTFNKEAYQALVDTLAASAAITNGILLFFAGVIAFALIYNIASVTLAERERELASLRVLGLTPRETGGVLLHESLLLSTAGILLGIPLGRALCRLLVHAYDTDLYRLPFHIEPRSHALAMLGAFVFVLLANALVWRRQSRLDMVAVLKERE